MDEISDFQIKLLCILSSEPKYGLGIKRELEKYYGNEVNHGRLYPNLDQLIEDGYVRKAAIDKRTNEYRLTEEGKNVLQDEIEWQLRQYMGGKSERINELEGLIDSVTRTRD